MQSGRHTLQLLIQTREALFLFIWDCIRVSSDDLGVTELFGHRQGVFREVLSSYAKVALTLKVLNRDEGYM